MKYLFILGRNPELSSAEIVSYFEKENQKMIILGEKENSILLETEKEIPNNAIKNLGGTIAIGKVLCEAESKGLEKINIYGGIENKLSYVIWNFSEANYDSVSEYLKKRFRQERLKASEKPLTGFMNIQDGKSMRIASGKIGEEYFVFDDFFGKIIQKPDYSEIESRDMDKPERREALAISPRLAKIMINLSGAKREEILLDPFCGIGVILQEALLQNMKVIGIDKDESAISGAKKNLEWGKFRKEDYNLFIGDSRRLKPGNAGVLVTEPQLGMVLKKSQTKDRAKDTMKRYETLMINVLNNLKKSVKGRIVFSSPYILLKDKKRLGCSIETICDKTGLRMIKSFKEYRQEQIVGREIWVMKGVER